MIPLLFWGVRLPCCERRDGKFRREGENFAEKEVIGNNHKMI